MASERVKLQMRQLPLRSLLYQYLIVSAHLNYFRLFWILLKRLPQPVICAVQTENEDDLKSADSSLHKVPPATLLSPRCLQNSTRNFVQNQFLGSS